MSLTTRLCAFNILTRVLRDGRTLDEVEPQHLDGLSPQDTRLTRAITLTVLRHRGEMSRAASLLMDNPFKKDSAEEIVLLIGFAQLHFLDGIAAHGAIHTTVELAKKKTPRIHGVINAILRRIQRDGWPLDEGAHLADNLPTWLYKKLEVDYGDTLPAMLPSLFTPPPQHIRLRDERYRDAYKAIATPLPLSPATWQLAADAPATHDLPGWDEGAVYIQNAASQLPAMVLAQGLACEGPVLDMCAAPGGKTIQLADALPERDLISADMKKKRLKRVEENLSRCRVSARVMEMDGTAPTLEKGSLAAVLLDAPCSATGTLRRHPDVLYTRHEKDISALSTLQDKLLSAMAPLIKAGGLLVYSTCSLLKEEGEARIDAFLAKNKEFERFPIHADDVGGLTNIVTTQGDLRPLPQDDMDGFYVARLRRKP